MSLIYSGSNDPIHKNDLMIYKDKYSFTDIDDDYIMNNADVSSVRVLDAIVIFTDHSDDIIFYYNKMNHQWSEIDNVAEYSVVEYLGKIYECLSFNGTEVPEVFMYDTELGRCIIDECGPIDIMTTGHKFLQKKFGDELDTMKIIEPKEIYNINWPNYRVTRTGFVDLLVVCSDY